MTQLQNDRLIRALFRQPVDVTPVWIMRQAGRYLPEYRKIREQAGSFLKLCTTPEMACEATLQPLRRFPLDAAILFSDILTIPDAMGLGLYFEDGEGPRFQRPIRSARDVTSLGIPDPETELRYVTDAVRLIHKELDGQVPLIGFSGSPWTLATYMVEGKSSKEFRYTKTLMFNEPILLHELLSKLAQAVTAYLNAQIAAGVQVVMLFDTWGGALSTPDYEIFSLEYMKRIIAGLDRLHGSKQIPVILFTKGGGQWLETMTNTGADALGIDWTTDLGNARSRVGDKVALQGNLDPSLLYADEQKIRDGVANTLASFGAGSGHIFNLGHGIHPGVGPEKVAVLVDAVHEMSAQYHQ